jgi:hypothetical protein
MNIRETFRQIACLSGYIDTDGAEKSLKNLQELHDKAAKAAKEAPVRTTTGEETATLLAALRYWQDRIRQNSDEVMEAQSLMPEHFQDHEPLDSGEIDQLCEAINFGTVG